MNDILRDLSTTSLIAAIEGNLFGLIPAFDKWPQAKVHDEAEIMWSMTDIPFPLFNSVMRAQLAPERVDAAIQSNLRETTTRVLASLTPREERVLRMRFGIGMNTDHTLEEVGQQFSVTRERIRQIEAKALRKLKHPSRSRKMRSFLDQ